MTSKNYTIHFNSMSDSLIKSLKKITPLYKVYQFIFRKNNLNKTPDNIPDIVTKRNDILKIANEYSWADTFVETGTLVGDTIEFFKNNFSKLYSIELDKELANRAIKRFSADDKIKIIQGNSSEQLKYILETINTTCIFWLDGHYSGEFSAGSEYIRTAKGDKNTPILEELNQISNHHLNSHIILIDDARLFFGQNDYPTIAKLKKYISKKFPGHSFEVKNDIIRILPIIING